MVLNGKNRKRAVPESFDGAIIEVKVGHLEIGRAPNSGLVTQHRKSVVLGGYEHITAGQGLDRVIPAPVAVRHLGRLTPVGQPQQLVAQTDAKGRNPGIGQRPNFWQRVRYSRRIPWTIAQEQPIRHQFTGLSCSSL